LSDLLRHLETYTTQGLLSPKSAALLRELHESYFQALAHSPEKEKGAQLFKTLIDLIVTQLRQPYSFDIFHRAIRSPFDYYQFGLDFIRPLVNFAESKIFGLEHLKTIQTQLQKEENVILLANHQTEPDPQIISLLLENRDPQLAAEMIFIAGHRVVSDPMAIPMSMGRNLLCIYSKKYIQYPPEEKAKKVVHNQRTMKKMGELLNEGGKCIYVAPSGGRDRPNATGEVEVAPFDPQSIELFWLMAQQAEKPTHFYPLALRTFALMPPPRHVKKELGEQRIVHFTPIYLAFGQEIDMEHFPGSESLDKKTKRHKRADYIWNQVCQSYRAFPC
jgi:glycerol-3-phosphate O-acyltransferase